MHEEEKMSILVVDDDPSTLQILLDYLEEWGFETLVATSGEQAIKQVQLFRPALILF